MYGRRNPAGGLYIRHADNVLVENFQVYQRHTDYRPAVVLDDVTDFRMRGLKAIGTETDELLQTIDCNNIKLMDN